MKKYLLKPNEAYIRIAPCGDKPWQDYSYSIEPLIFKRRNEDGNLVFSYHPDTLNSKLFSNNEVVLNEMWDDDNWIPFGVLNQMEKTALSKYKGKYVVRIKPVKLQKDIIDKSYTYGCYKLITATKYHVVIYDSYLKNNIILDSRYANPDDWKVV